MRDGRLAVWGIAGSLRRESWNRKLLASAAALAPDDVDVRITTLLPDIPPFNEDLIGPDEPMAVTAMREEIAAADALLVATPEYNGGVPGVLKNAFDWISLPLGASVLQHRPVMMIGTSIGRLGTARSQFELRHMFVFSQSTVLPGPEVVLPYAPQAFDEQGALVDPVAIERIGQLFAGLKRLVRVNQEELESF